MSSDEQEILDLFATWNAALKTGDPDEVVRLYGTDGVLIPTLSNVVRTTHAAMRDYFVHFLKNQPEASLRERHVRRFGDIAINSGLYSFYMGANGSTVEARYTFVYSRAKGDWRIVEHHSSLLPEEHAKIDKSVISAF